MTCVYAVLKNKTQAHSTYIGLFEELFTLNLNLRPAALVDFELAFIEIKGSFFHPGTLVEKQFAEFWISGDFH